MNTDLACLDNRRLSRAGGHGVRQEAEPAADRGRRGDPDRDPPRVCGRVCGDDGCGVQAWLPALHAHPPGSAIAPLPRRRHVSSAPEKSILAGCGMNHTESSPHLGSEDEAERERRC
eukprot:1884294-Rhodomonas_salina.4